MPSISKFISNFSEQDLARPNRFTASISYPQKLGIKGNTLSCETAELPSITYATTEQKFGSNPIEKYPYQVQFNDINLTFIVKEDIAGLLIRYKPTHASTSFETTLLRDK